MTQQDINNANANGEGEVYTFEDVELNYDGDNDTEYTAEGAKGRMGKGKITNISTATMITKPMASSRSAATMISISQERCISNRARLLKTQLSSLLATTSFRTIPS